MYNKSIITSFSKKCRASTIPRLVSSLVQWHLQEPMYLWYFSSMNLSTSVILRARQTCNNLQHVNSQPWKGLFLLAHYFIRARIFLPKSSLVYSSYISTDLYYISCPCLNQSLAREMESNDFSKLMIPKLYYVSE